MRSGDTRSTERPAKTTPPTKSCSCPTSTAFPASPSVPFGIRYGTDAPCGAWRLSTPLRRQYGDTRGFAAPTGC